MNSTMKRMKYLILIAFCFIVPGFLFAAKITAAETEQIQHIYDNAGLLSTSEADYLDEMCTEYGNDAGIDIIILTHNDSNAVYAERYIENFYDNMLYGDSVILLVDMYNREVFIEGYGTAESKINSSRIDDILDKITPHISDEEYKTAFEKYIKLSAKYMNLKPIYLRAWFQFIIAIAVGAITVAIMAYNSGGKMTVGSNTYMDPNHSGLIGRRDDYIRTQVTRVRKPTQNSGGGGGISPGGHSHSSGGRKF
jgi:uncharacterized protein